MELVSDTIQTGGPAQPNAPEVYPRVAINTDLSDPYSFTGGVPHSAFAEMRATAPVSWREENNGSGFWALTRYDDIARVNSDPSSFSSQRGGIVMSGPSPEQRDSLMAMAQYNNMVNIDGPTHLLLRREHMPYFTSDYIESLKHKVRAEIDRLLDTLPTNGEWDFVENFSAKLPLFTICEMLGVPEEDRGKFSAWMETLEQVFVWLSTEDPPEGSPAAAARQSFMEHFKQSTDDLFAFGRHLLHKRRADPQSDLMSAIASIKVDGEYLVDEYLDGSWLTVVFAGNDTTRNTISESIKLLTENPDQLDLLTSRPHLASNAVHEFLRLASPIIYMRRTANCDTIVNGQVICEGEKVLMYYPAANRDDAIFPDPDRLDIERSNSSKHIAFGFGPHVCLGQRIAQMQLGLVHDRLWTRFPNLRYAGGIRRAPNNFAYCITHLPVTLS